MPFPSSRSYVGIAKETVRGTPVAPTASIPLLSMTPHDEITLIDDTGLRGSMVDLYGDVAGPVWATWDATGHVYPDTIGFWLASILPDVVTTGAGPFVHVFTVKNTTDGQPKGYTIADYNAIGATSGARYFPGAGVSELTFKFDAAAALTYDVKTTTFASSLVPSSAPTKTFGALVPIPGYLPVISVGGSQVTTVEAGDITIARAVTPIHTGDSSAAPYSLFSGPVAVSGNLTFVAEDETELLRYLGNTQPALDLTFTGITAINNTTVIQLHMTSVVYKPADPIRTKDYVEIQVAFRGKANATDVGASGGFSAIKVSLTNSNASGTYA